MGGHRDRAWNRTRDACAMLTTNLDESRRISTNLDDDGCKQERASQRALRCHSEEPVYAPTLYFRRDAAHSPSDCCVRRQHLASATSLHGRVSRRKVGGRKVGARR